MKILRLVVLAAHSNTCLKMNYCKPVILLICILVLSSCTKANIFNSQISKNQSSISNNSPILESETDKTSPLEINVAQAFFVKNKLEIKVLLTAKEEMSAENINLTAFGLNKGNIIEKVSKNVQSELKRNRIRKNEVLAMFFSLSLIHI